MHPAARAGPLKPFIQSAHGLITERTGTELGQYNFARIQMETYTQSHSKRLSCLGAEWCFWVYRGPYTNLCVQELTVQIFVHADHLYCLALHVVGPYSRGASSLYVKV